LGRRDAVLAAYAGLVLAGCAITAELVVRAWRSRHRDTEARTPVA
jgi:hypothetical protein